MYSDRRGVSPVISVILMLGLAVSIAAIASLTSFDLQQGVSQNADITLTVDVGQGVATVRYAGNVDSLALGSNRSENLSDVTAGDTLNLLQGEPGIDEQTIVATVNGNEQLVRKVDIEIPDTVSGTVAVNPPIPGATVEAIDTTTGNLVATDTTDTNGAYSVEVPEPGRTTITVDVDGFTFEGRELYASASTPGDASSTSIDFDETQRTNTTIDGSPVSVIYQTNAAGDRLVGNLRQLQAMNGNLGADYTLMSDIDATDTQSNFNGGAGFAPIGPDFDNKFTGSFDGQGHAIDGLFINRTSTNNVGLFGEAGSDSVVKNVTLTTADVTGGGNRVGGLVGINRGTVSKASASGSVSGESYYVGGLVGANYGGSISDSYATGDVSARSEVGGLVGQNYGDVSTSYATGDVSAQTSGVGGLVGDDYGSISSSYWDTQASGQDASAGGTGLTTSEMQGASAETNMVGFDFTNTWKTVTGECPQLQALND